MKVAPLSFCKSNQRSNDLCIQINQLYRQGYTTRQIATELKLSKSSVRYYYYGVHHCPVAYIHWKNAFDANKELGYVQDHLNQVRVGTFVPI